MSAVLIRGMLCYLGILLVMYDCINLVTSDVCSTQGLTFGGGPGQADGKPTQGCTNACPPTIRLPEIHVIAHNKGPDVTYSSPNPKVPVYVYLNNDCSHGVNVALVLVSQWPTKWLIKYGCFEKDNSCHESQHSQRLINLVEVDVIQTVQTDQTFMSTVKAVEWNPRVIYSEVSVELYRNNWDEEALELLKSRHIYLTSISRANQVSEWHLTVGERCCFGKTTPRPKTTPTNLEPTSDKSPPLSPLGTGSPDTAPVSGSNPQGKNITIIAGTVIVILTIVILIGTCWYHHKYNKQPEPNDVQEANMSSLEGTGIHVEPNIYNVSPVSNHVETHDFSEGHLPPEVDPSAPPLPPRLY